MKKLIDEKSSESKANILDLLKQIDYLKQQILQHKKENETLTNSNQELSKELNTCKGLNAKCLKDAEQAKNQYSENLEELNNKLRKQYDSNKEKEGELERLKKQAKEMFDKAMSSKENALEDVNIKSKRIEQLEIASQRLSQHVTESKIKPSRLKN